MQQLEQRINLYRPPAKSSGKPFTSASALKMLGIALAAMTLIQIYGAIRVLIHEAQIEPVRRQAELLEAQVKKIEAQAQRPQNRLLESRIDALREKVEQNKRMFTQLNRVREERVADFSGYLKGLAERTPQGVWLTQILIDAAQGVDLRGGVTNPALAPAFVRSLESVPAFQGVSFGRVELSKAAGQDYLSFRLSSAGMGDKKP